MAGRDLPPPRTGAETYLAAVVDRLDALIDRLDRQQSAAPDGQVELREPKTAASSPPGSGEGSGADERPARPAAKQATKPAARKRTTTKTTKEP